MTERKRQFKIIGFLILLSISLFLPFFQNNLDVSYEENRDTDFIKTSAQRSVTKQWIKNSNFSSVPIEPTWYWENGTEGDNSDMDATTGTGQVNYDVLGETRTFTVVSGIINSSTSPGWKYFNKIGFLSPDTASIESYGCYVSHFWNDGPNQFPSAQWKTNISVPIDMSDYVITSASLEVIVNASVDDNVDTPNDSDSWENFAIGDSVTFYSQISDLEYNPPLYTVASNKTKYLGQQNTGFQTILTIPDSPLEPVSQIDLITALNSAFEKDPSHSNFSLTLGIDIYSEDNLGSADPDNFNDLIIKTCNLTFTVKKKIDQSTTISWNQVGNTLDSASVQVTDAKFFFKYKVNNTWPISAPLSEIILYINDKAYDEGIIKITSANQSWKEAKIGGFDVTSLISTDVNITIAIEVFLKDTFELGQVYSISIDNVYLNISYIETFPDYGTDLELFLDGEDKTLDPVIQIPIKDMLNITVTYKDNVSGNHISADSATLEGKVSGDLTESIALEQYYYIVNSTDLGLGISVLTITLQKVNYETESIQIFIDVIERETELQLLVDDTPRSNNETIDVKFNEFLNFTVFYEDNLTNTYIDAALVELLGFGGMNETVNQYNFTLNTNDLSQGVNVITIFAQKNNYQSQTIQVYVNVVERATQLILYINSVQKFDSDALNSQFDEFINITIFYIDDLTSFHIDGSSVELLGFGSMNETINQYNLTLNTNDLVQGVNVLTIFAQKGSYQSQTIQFFINIQIRTTYVEFYVEGEKEVDGVTIDTQFDVILNVTVIYRDNNTDSHLAGADVDLLGLGSLDEIGTQFNYSIQTNLLVKGINILTIFCQLDGYQAQTIQFFINVDERATELILYINGNQENQSATVQFEANELINITVFYKDYLSDTHLSGTNVELLGFGIMNETLNQYNFTLNTNDLEQGINILTIFAQLLNYQPKSIQFFIEVIERATEMQLLININGNVTTDPVFEITIGTVVNITIKFYDLKTGLEIPNALLQLIGESLFENLTENLIFNQYSIILNNLSLDLKLFTVVAQAPTYQINTTDIRITVNPVSTSIDTVSGLNYVNISPNEDFLIQIVLNNTDFGGTIKNATVTYRWENGQGILTDSNNDGIYEVTLNNVPEGSYLISINAYAGENYEFRGDFEIVLNAIATSGLDFTIIIVSLAAGLVGLTVAFVLYQKHFRYPPKVRIIRKIRKKISKGKKIKPLTLSTRDNIIAGETERNREILKVEKEIVDKKPGGETLE
ncbi:MAG: hypothetical protein HWN80_03640 [Candidatus Lokiarchaeota archaeon]|nr:hypothetical protein [Candidatus Lokiarchaeota archaeon]